MNQEGSECSTPTSNADKRAAKKLSKADKSENGEGRSLKKKKKDKDRERDRDRAHVRNREREFEHERHLSSDRERYNAAAMSGGKRLGGLDSPMKRKHDNEMNSSISSADGCTLDNNISYNKRLHLDSGGNARHRDRDRLHDRANPNNRVPAGINSYGSYNEFPDRWSHGRDRYGGQPADFKRDRYDSFNNRNNSFHHRDRERDRDRRSEKRRYPLGHGPPPIAYPPSHFMPPGYYMANGALPPAAMPHAAASSNYRDPRVYANADWSGRDARLDYAGHPSDYRRTEYERRSQT